MRRKKHKQTRRAINFYKINYGFHEPYKVLLDGNFIHVTKSSNLGDLSQHLPNLLDGRVNLYTTRCVTSELRQLPVEEYGAAFKSARGHMLHKCGHDENPIAACDCLLEQIARNNEGHWFVATQDATLRRKLEKIPGCPVIFASVNGIHLGTPSEMTKANSKEVEEATRAVPEHERRSEALQDLERIRTQVQSSARFRKNKAKGPNPLSIRRKQKNDGKVSKKVATDKAKSEGKESKSRRSRRKKTGGSSLSTPSDT